jgi:hypothetical protein
MLPARIPRHYSIDLDDRGGGYNGVPFFFVVPSSYINSVSSDAGKKENGIQRKKKALLRI